MGEATPEMTGKEEDWERVDSRVLGQILAAQVLLFVLPDEKTISEFFAQAIGAIPGVASCFVCLGEQPPPSRPPDEVCVTCATLRTAEGPTVTMPSTLSCGLSSRHDIRTMPVRTNEHSFGFFVFVIESSDVFTPYIPFLNNLANQIALSLENRIQKDLLESARDELEDRVRARTDELHALNSHIRTINQELEQRVMDRTAQLEASNKELEAFAYSVSHDLRAPLRHIDGFLELLRGRIGGVLDAKSAHYIDTVADSARRMGTLIDDLLTFSRMGRHAIRKTPVDLDTLVREVYADLVIDAAGRNIDWNIAPLPVVTCDRTLMRSVLNNLLSNAVKFTRPRDPATIDVGHRAENNETVIFVRDNGVGFDPMYSDKLFGVFQRLHRADEFEGTGVGLANVRRIINRHGGRTWAEGRTNAGATFYFSLPSHT